MRALEAEAIASGTVSGLELMERAGRGVVAAIFEEWPDLAAAPHRAVVLCGPGNNGGDGFVVARLLRDWGWEVAVFLYGDPERLPPDARVNHARWRERGEVSALSRATWGAAVGAGAGSVSGAERSLLIDALFGTGLTRAIDLPLVDLAPDRMRRPERRIVSVDLPSGLCSDSGAELGAGQRAVRADLTVTFHAEKLGHRLASGPVACGKIAGVDIGLAGPAALGPAATGIVRLIGMEAALAAMQRRPEAHKYHHGHALVVSGAMGRSGAARLAARGALRVGAGLATVAAPGSAMMECAAQLTAIMLRRVEDGAGLAGMLEDGRINALCLGPGLGLARARDLVPVALQDRAGAPAVVLDADALTAFADAPEALFAMLHPRCVLTPHAGEFARLFPDIAARLDAPATRGPAYSKVEATREAAARAGCVVLFKGADTVIADASGACSINSAVHERAAPWLATAGAGDVLAGMIAGLLARGLAPMQAAETAAWLHVEAARAFGPGLIAEDLPEMLPRVFGDLEL